MPARIRLDPGDISPDAAARRMGLTRAEFDSVLPRLLSRGFPLADRDTGMFDLDAIDAWRRRRHPGLFSAEPTLTISSAERDVKGLIRSRIAEARRSSG